MAVFNDGYNQGYIFHTCGSGSDPPDNPGSDSQEIQDPPLEKTRFELKKIADLDQTWWINNPSLLTFFYDKDWREKNHLKILNYI